MNYLDTLKQAREALEDSLGLVECDYVNDWRHGLPTRKAQLDASLKSLEKHKQAIGNLTAVIAELEKAEPVAWRYTVSLGPDEIRSECSGINWNEKYQPFGRPGIDFNERGRVTKQPLYLHPSDDAKLREDAERYCYLVKHLGDKPTLNNQLHALFDKIGNRLPTKEELDAAIDAARAVEGEKP